MCTNVITSSKVLSKRDVDEYKKFYKLLNINCFDNCEEVDLIVKKERYNTPNTILYGDL